MSRLFLTCKQKLGGSALSRNLFMHQSVPSDQICQCNTIRCQPQTYFRNSYTSLALKLVSSNNVTNNKYISTSAGLSETFRRKQWRNTEYKPLLLEEEEDLSKDIPEESYRTNNVITVPFGLERRLEKKLRNETTKRSMRLKSVELSRLGKKSEILIRCKRKEFNHYLGQSYERGNVTLASKAWHHRKSPGDFFTLYPGLKRESPFYMSGTESTTFQDLGISDIICNNLKQLGIESPTHIQVFAIPQILKEGRNVVAAETGCGKTLVYLLPMIQQVLEDKKYSSRQKPGHPTCIIVVPSRELADQIYQVALQLTFGLDISVKLLQGGNLRSKLINAPTSKAVDILIATSNALKVLTAAGVYETSRILHLVLDEADSLLDDSFFPELVGPFLNRLQWNDIQRNIQLTLVCATVPNDMKSTIGQIIPVDSLQQCSTPGVHHLLPHVPQTFFRVRKSQKPDKIKEIVGADFEKVPTIIFCNQSKTCDWLAGYLNDEGIDCASVHGRMPLRYRRGRIEMYQNGEINVIVATDLASRGIDTVRTKHVVNYEFPLFTADYIHRCGRTGRVGSQEGSHVTNLISRPGEVHAVNELEKSVRMEKSVSNVNANIKRLYGKMYGDFVEIQPIQNKDNKKTSNEENYESSVQQ